MRRDYAYKRNGVANLFILFQPSVGKRYVEITDHGRRLEWAQVMRTLSDELYPRADKIVVVLAKLNTHTPAAFCLAFQPEEVRRLVERSEFHFAPKHAVG